MTTWLKRAVLLLALCFVAFTAALPDDDDVASPQWPVCIRGSHRAMTRSLSGQSSLHPDISWRLPVVSEPGSPFTSPPLALIGNVAIDASLPKAEIRVAVRFGRAPPSFPLV